VIAPLKLTAPLLPKFVPVIVIEAVTVPDGGDMLIMLGTAPTVKVTLLLFMPPTVTRKYPDVAPDGTGTMI
jgi:hypothetical protein